MARVAGAGDKSSAAALTRTTRATASRTWAAAPLVLQPPIAERRGRRGLRFRLRGAPTTFLESLSLSYSRVDRRPTVGDHRGS